MAEMSRRSFVASMGTVAAAGLAAASADVALAADEGGAAEFVPGGGSFAEGGLGDWTGTPAEIEAVGGSTMPWEELNRRRRAYIGSKTEDHVCADGQVIPVAYVKAAAMLNSMGIGTICGYDGGVTPVDNGVFPDDGLRAIVADLDEEQALFYSNLHADVEFNVIDASVATGVPVKECYELLAHLHYCGYLAYHSAGDGVKYHINPWFQGVTEYFTANHFLRADKNVVREGGCITTQPAKSSNNVTLEAGTSVFHAAPCNASVVAEDSQVLDYDNIREILSTKEIIGIGPCFCRYRQALGAESETLPAWEQFVGSEGSLSDYVDPISGHFMETCISTGDEAESAIELGFLRRCTTEEALAAFDRAVEEGYVVNVGGGKRAETICCCHLDAGCGILGAYAKLGDALQLYPAFQKVSRYELVVDLDACLSCGACVDRCPMHIISMDENGKPVVASNCIKCGQCGYTCPVGARKLVALPEEEQIRLQDGFRADNMVKAAYRFEHGYIQ